MTVHPLIHLICVLLPAFSLAAMDAWERVAIAVVLIVGVAVHGADALRGLLWSVYRLRYLLASIALLAWWFVPGGDLPDASWLPSTAALAFVADRLVLLVGLVAAAELLRRAMPVPTLASAIASLFAPLRPLGLNPAPFARRVALTLAAVPWARERAAALHCSPSGSGIDRIAAAATALIADAEARARQTSQAFDMPALSPPAALQWMLPLAVALLLALLGGAG